MPTQQDIHTHTPTDVHKLQTSQECAGDAHYDRFTLSDINQQTEISFSRTQAREMGCSHVSFELTSVTRSTL